MTREECIQQLDSLIEHFHNGGSDFNATDVLAIKKILEQNQKYKEVIDKIRNAIDGDIDGFGTINEHGECNGILELLEIYKDILKEVK